MKVRCLRVVRMLRLRRRLRISGVRIVSRVLILMIPLMILLISRNSPVSRVMSRVLLIRGLRI